MGHCFRATSTSRKYWFATEYGAVADHGSFVQRAIV